jgi:hypothetical protein
MYLATAGPCGIPLFWIVLLLYLLLVFESHLDLPALENNNLVQYIWNCHCVRCWWPWCYKLCGTCDTCLQYYMLRWLRWPSRNFGIPSSAVFLEFYINHDEMCIYLELFERVTAGFIWTPYLYSPLDDTAVPTLRWCWSKCWIVAPAKA